VSIYALKPRFQALLRPLAAALPRSGVAANQVTVWMFVRMALNAFDGMPSDWLAKATEIGR